MSATSILTLLAQETGHRAGVEVSADPHRRKRPVGVVTVDDQAVFRSVARELIEATTGFEPLGEAASGDEALALAAELDADLMLIDVRMPGIDGLETARRLSISHPDVIVVLVSTDALDGSCSAIEACGAVAFVRKQDLAPSMLERLWAEHGRRRTSL